MRGIASQEQPAVLHRLGDDAAHRRDVLLRDHARVGLPPIVGPQPRRQLLPDAIVGPLLEVFVGLALQVEARDAQRPHAEEREAVLMEAVDQLRARGRGLREDPEPRKRIDALVKAQHRRRHGWPADPVEPVAAGDEITGNGVVVAVVPVADGRLRRVDVVHADVLRHKRQRTAVALARGNQIPDDLALPVHRDRAAAGEPRQIDVVPHAAKRQVDAVVPQPLARQAIADAHRVHQVHRALFEHPGTDPFDDVLAIVPLDDGRVDAGLVQQLPQHQARGTCADDADLSAVGHGIADCRL